MPQFLALYFTGPQPQEILFTFISYWGDFRGPKYRFFPPPLEFMELTYYWEKDMSLLDRNTKAPSYSIFLKVIKNK